MIGSYLQLTNIGITYSGSEDTIVCIVHFDLPRKMLASVGLYCRQTYFLQLQD